MRKYMLLLCLLVWVVSSFARTDYLPYATRNKAELDAMLTGFGAGAFTAQFDQPFVYQIHIESQWDVEHSIDKMLMHLGVIPDFVIGYGANHASSEVSLVAIGASEAAMHNFNTGSWVNLTPYCNSANIYAKVETSGPTDGTSYMTLWLGSNTSLGYSFTYDTIEGSFNEERVSIQGYVISPDIVSVPIPYTQVNITGLHSIMIADGAAEYVPLFDDQYVYKITATSYYNHSTGTDIQFHFGQEAKHFIGKSNGRQFMPVKIGKNTSDMYQFNSTSWEYLLYGYCDSSDVYLQMTEDVALHDQAKISLWIGFSSTLGSDLIYEIIGNGNGPESFTIQGYQVSGGSSAPITYNTITKAALDDLFADEGAGSFSAGFIQNYIYRIRISSYSGYEAGTTAVLMHLGHTPAKVIASSTDGMSQAGIGTPAAFHELEDVDWEDVTPWCNGSDIKARIMVNWVSHSSNSINIWMGFSSSLGNSLLYDIIENWDAPRSFTIQGYQIGNEVTFATRNLAYEPVTQPDIDTLFMTDGADEFISQFRDYDYLYRFDLYSKTNLTKGNKIKVHLNDTADKVIAYSNGTTRQLATIGKLLTQQQLFGIGAWKDVTQYVNEQDFYIVMIDDPTEHYPGHLRLWLGSNNWLGQSLTYETVDNATPPDSFFVRSFRQSDLTVEDVQVLTHEKGQAEWLREGDQYYFDRDYYILNMADSLRNLVWIKTANEDKNSTADSLLKISVDRPADVFIGYDHRGTTLPPWLADNFTQTSFSIDVLDFASPLRVWRQHVPAGLFALGGNLAGGAEGARSNYIVLIDVQEPLPPIAVFDYTPKQGVHPLSVQFTNQSSGEIDSLRWDFGDGQSSVESNPLHVYTTVDTFTVSLTVFGPGGMDSDSAQVQVTELPPVAAFAADTTAGVVPLTITFADSSTGVITSWLWDFGDGQTSDQQNPVHVYTIADTLTVSLTVTGPGGADTETKTDFIIAYAPPVAAFTYEEVAEPPLTLNFHDNSTGIITSWQWDFGDGDFSTEQNPSHTFVKTDTFTVILLVQGPGGSSSKSQNIIVTGGQPIAEFEADSTTGVRPFSAQFYDRSSGIISSRAWDFGDGGTSNEQHPVHVYTTADTFTVTLTVTGPGGSDAMTKIDYIIVKEAPPVSAFAANFTSGIRPLTVAFADSSKGVITSRVWDFGDGVQSSDTNPIHTYTTADTFSVTLTVTGPGGSDTEIKTGYIIVREQPPVAAFAADSTSGEI
ncbi:MAG TPA: PKD domain-containing protein, partial [bacterium]|nr:PKD domain-containing protein [bacterium]